MKMPLLQTQSKPVAARYVAAQAPRAKELVTRESDEPSDLTEAEHTILIVDDDPVNRQVLLNLLSTERYRVLAADSGSTALKLREEFRPLILLLRTG